MKLKYIVPILLFSMVINLAETEAQQPAAEKYRPEFHFTPKAHWMNDPNGMVYDNGVYHLFYQYYPNGLTWGPMHWGHATTRDFFNWQEQPIALYPDSLGMIFSGSIVLDKNNTAGFGANAMVAIFTHHNQKIEEAKTGRHQYQSIAYSTDQGATWTKYKGNPVLPNPGITDFRDPKVMWYEPEKKWIMTLATKDRITFYSSADLKSWKRESDFGSDLGAHGGVWECPDLFPLQYRGKTIWVLLVSINPGGPNGGSATQYFTGSFDGHQFIPMSKTQKWLDYGADNYAGVTWSNTGDRKIFIGWMNNWQYANVVPTKTWRGATTLPRNLTIDNVKGEFLVRAMPVKELIPFWKAVYTKPTVSIGRELNLSSAIAKLNGKLKLDFTLSHAQSFKIAFTNKTGNKLFVGYNKADNSYFIDRTAAGVADFEPGFAKKHAAPRLTDKKLIKISVILDAASVELFADDGLTVMTDVFFPETGLSGLTISSEAVKLNNLSVSKPLNADRKY
ncbi:glycoside hydrolase family 32 protein [Pedobacter duraquae]|uniref:Fructan beta-fructosidase n=1 Tax=Pedobacter duraquae TaxID=425511 RepID=A0A4V3C447_9SPHI|nr:glycoside hydrolase family 32 protein [Pedobacter duraquae]TDO24578.1 fructan beta-fructosidase [Pedobacter duraquae]